jgi:hypothetical protein
LEESPKCDRPDVDIIEKFQKELIYRELIRIPRNFSALRSFLQKGFPQDPLTQGLDRLEQAWESGTSWVEQEKNFLKALRELSRRGSRFNHVLREVLVAFSPEKASTQVLFVNKSQGDPLGAYLRSAISRKIGVTGTSSGDRVFPDQPEIGGEFEKTAQLVQNQLIRLKWLDFGNYVKYDFDDKLIYAEYFDKEGRSAGLAFAYLALIFKIENCWKLNPYLAFFGSYGVSNEVGPVEGIKEKVKAAKENGVRLLIVEESNASEIQDGSQECVILKYTSGSLEEVLDSILEKLTEVTEVSDTFQSAKTQWKSRFDSARKPELQRVAIAFQSHFKTAGPQIHKLTTYKVLHDKFYSLAYSYHMMSRAKSSSSRMDVTEPDELIELEVTRLQKDIEELLEIVEQADFIRFRTVWTNELTRVLEVLRRGIEDRDMAQLDAGLSLLERIPNEHLPRINEHLIIMADSLTLSEFIKEMTLLCNLSGFHQFRDYVNQNAEMDKTLSIWVGDHYFLQELDKELQGIEPFLEKQDLRNFWDSWERVHEKIQSHPDGEVRDWIRKLLELGTKLRGALSEQNPRQIKGCFDAYRRQVRNTLNRVDKSLLKLYRELKGISEKVNSMLEGLQHG